MINEHTKYHATVQAQALAAMSPVAAGNAEFGMSNSSDATFFATATGYYEGQKKHDNLRNIGAMTTFRVGLFVRKDFADQEHQGPQGQAAVGRLQCAEDHRPYDRGAARQCQDEL